MILGVKVPKINVKLTKKGFCSNFFRFRSSVFLFDQQIVLCSQTFEVRKANKCSSQNFGTFSKLIEEMAVSLMRALRKLRFSAL